MVAIKGMKMPTKCSNCQILILLGYAVGCGGTNPHKLLEKDFLYIKPEWCPLVELSEMSSMHNNPEDTYREDFGGNN